MDKIAVYSEKTIQLIKEASIYCHDETSLFCIAWVLWCIEVDDSMDAYKRKV